MGCSRGGFGTAIHAAVTPLGHPVTLELTGSECSDCPRRPGLIAGTEAVAVLADKGYDSDANDLRQNYKEWSAAKLAGELLG